MPKLPDMSQAAIRRRQALTEALNEAKDAKSAKTPKAAPKRGRKRG